MIEVKVDSDTEDFLKRSIESKTDTESLRIKRYLSMPDLSRQKWSPLYELIQKVKSLDIFKDFVDLKIPEIIPASISFDLFNFPPDHPARSKSDTYYVDQDNILRTHTTVSWYYYLTKEEGKKRIAEDQDIGVICYGKVYRKDEIDKSHMNVFHQIDGWYIIPKKKGVVNIDDLKNVLVKIIQSVFGENIKYRFNPDSFPYTDPSLEMEIEVSDRWIEVLGCGVINGNVLEKLGVDHNNYTGWAFGFGLERLAIISMDLPDIRLLWSEDERVKRQLKLGNKFIEVSKYPPVVRDVSFVVDNTFIPNNYFDLVRDVLGDIVEQVEMLDKYENKEKFGEGKISYAFRITYRSLERTLTNNEVDEIHRKLEDETRKIYKAIIR